VYTCIYKWQNELTKYETMEVDSLLLGQAINMTVKYLKGER